MKITFHSHLEVITTECQNSHFQNEAKCKPFSAYKNEFTLVLEIVFISMTSLLASLLKQRLR